MQYSNIIETAFGFAIYALGGFDNNVPLRSAELYDLERDEWTQVGYSFIMGSGTELGPCISLFFRLGKE